MNTVSSSADLIPVSVPVTSFLSRENPDHLLRSLVLFLLVSASELVLLSLSFMTFTFFFLCLFSGVWASYFRERPSFGVCLVFPYY